MSISVEVTRTIDAASVRFVATADTQDAAVLLAQFLATSKQALDIAASLPKAEAPTIISENKPSNAVLEKAEAATAKELTEAKKPQASASDTTPKSGEATSNSEPENATAKAYTFAEVQKLVTTLAAPGAHVDGRAKAVVALQRHGLKKFTEEQVKGDQAVIDAVGALLEATIAGEVDPREGN